MMRRRHKKSRRGCLECKKRHIKCDETHPRCINCATVDRECQYSAPNLGLRAEGSPSGSASAGTSPQPSAPIYGPAISPGPDPASASFPALFMTGPSAPFLTGMPAFSSNIFPTMTIPPDLNPNPLNSKVDITHMQLFYHYLTNHTEIYRFAMGELQNIIVKMALYSADQPPFLIHSLLAVSARHLSSVHQQTPPTSKFYHDLAIQLQTQALSLFNSFDVDYFGQSLERRLPVFIFSAVIGFHALCDMLSFRDDDFSVALKRFTDYLKLHRGIISVMDGYWEDLKKTELSIVFQMGVPDFYQESTQEGKECGDLVRRLEAAGLEEEQLAGAKWAVRALQWVFDAAPDHAKQLNVLCGWAIIVPQPVVEMMEQGRGEALSILAYFFLALHYCRRKVWLIGDSGEFLLRGLVRFLGEGWREWVEGALVLLEESLVLEEREGGGEEEEGGSQFGVSPTNASTSSLYDEDVGFGLHLHPDDGVSMN